MRPTAGPGDGARRATRVDAGPVLLLAGAVLLSVAMTSVNPAAATATPSVFIPLTALLPILIALCGGAWLPAAWSNRVHAAAIGLLLGIGLISLGVATGRLVVRWQNLPGVMRPVLLLAIVMVGARAAWMALHRADRAGGAALVALGLGSIPILLRVPDARIDVQIFQHDGVAALLRGINPYTLTFANPYSLQESILYYGTGLFDAEGRLLFGFPYPPASLLLVVPGALLGDVRLSMVGAVVLASMVVWRQASTAFERACAVALAVLPGAPLIMVNAWTEPLLVGLLATAVVGMRRHWRATPYLLGVLLVSKQYLVVILPLLWLLRGTARTSAMGLRGFAARVVGSALAVSVPLAVWSPIAFWDSVVRLQLRQPFRADSTSLLVWLVNRTGWPPPSVYGWLPLAAGLLTACLLAWRAPRTPAGFAGAVGVTLLVTFMLSKQAFANYYYLALGALLIAAGTWEARDPTDAPAAGSAPSREPPGRRPTAPR
jgi:hypothetical protein